VTNSNLGPIPHHLRDTAFVVRNFPLKIAAKQLQMETCLLLTADRSCNCPIRWYHNWPPTTYHLATIHPWQTDRRTDNDNHANSSTVT